MKIAVMSDIHGNYIALQRCLAHALEQNVDAYIFLGDYLGEFPYPQRTLEILYELKQNASCIFIRGNKEDYWLNRRKDQNCDWKSGNRSVMAMIYNYNMTNVLTAFSCQRTFVIFYVLNSDITGGVVHNYAFSCIHRYIGCR